MKEPATKEPATLVTIDHGDLARKDWIATRDDLLTAAAAIIEIADGDAYTTATEQVAKLRKHRKELADHRLTITRRLDDVKRDLMTQEKKLGDRLDAEENRLKALAGDYATRIAREREEAERARREAEAAAALAAEQAEAARLAAINAAADLARQADQEEAAVLFGAGAVLADAATPDPAAIAAAEAARIAAEEAAQAAEAAAYAPVAPDRTKAGGGVRQVKVYKFEIVDPTALDRKFLSPDEQKVRAFVQYCKSQGIAPEAIAEPGLRIWEEVAIR